MKKESLVFSLHRQPLELHAITSVFSLHSQIIGVNLQSSSFIFKNLGHFRVFKFFTLNKAISLIFAKTRLGLTQSADWAARQAMLQFLCPCCSQFVGRLEHTCVTEAKQTVDSHMIRTQDLQPLRDSFVVSNEGGKISFEGNGKPYTNETLSLRIPCHFTLEPQ